MGKIGKPAHPINKGKPDSNQGKDNTIDSPVDKDVHDQKKRIALNAQSIK